MKIPTNAIELELTVEMVRPGMVFLDDRNERCMPWFGLPGWRLVGCDPSVATRSDCERFGIAPGIDAGGHGFARLRGGGATHCAGMVLRSDSAGLTWTVRTPGIVSMPPVDDLRFVGLDARHAPREDVERLCCWDAGPLWKNGVATDRCSLAIGHDGAHEDLATGVRWERDLLLERQLPLTGASASLYKAMCERASSDIAALVLPKDMVLILQCTATSESLPTRIVINGLDGDEIVDLARIEHDGTFVCRCGSVNPAVHFETCKLPWQYRMAATWAVNFTNARGDGLSRVVQEGLLGACAVALLVWCCRLWDTSPPGQLAARDAAVSRAIADVPEGCSASGWANVVRVLAADAEEQSAWSAFDEEVGDVREPVGRYARARFVFGYSPAEATLWALAAEGIEDPGPDLRACAGRIFAAYEAGR